jgi:hypothetical protein
MFAELSKYWNLEEKINLRVTNIEVCFATERLECLGS